MRLRTLNSNGVELFRSYLQGLRSGTAHDTTLKVLLNDTAHSQPAQYDVDLKPKHFTEKRALAEYVCSEFTRSGRVSLPVEPGIWSWMAVFFFDSICPTDPLRARAIREDARYIFVKSYNRDYRHRIAGPARTYWHFRDRPSDASLLLYGPPYELSDYEEQLASRQQRIQNKALIGLATRYYFDLSSKRPRAGGQGRNVPGNLRRLIRVLEQFERTYDLYSMSTDRLIELLPTEFERWRQRIDQV